MSKMSTSVTPEPGTERALRNTTRNPRRRPRQSDSDSLKTAPRRKRSKLNDDTFAPKTGREANGDAVAVPSTEGTKRGPGRARKESTPLVGAETELIVRGGKKQGSKRAHRSDGATTLTQNTLFSVKALPSTPKELKRDGVEYRGYLCASSSRALAVTHQAAYVWDYTAHTSTGAPRAFDLPFPSKPTDPLPFGALVTSGVSSEVGLVLLSPATGKVVFYDSIERAASLSLFQSRSVVATEGALGSLFGSETVSDIVSAASAGFIVTTSAGRIFQLTLRDASGKPRIQSQPLRSQEAGSGGIFGSIKGMLGAGSWKRDVCAVHTRSLGQRGLVQVVSVTERGECQMWDLDWSGRYEFRGTIDFRETLFTELSQLAAPELQGRAEHFAVRDFVFQDSRETVGGQELVKPGDERTLELALLVRVGDPISCEHVLVEVSLGGERVRIARLMLLKSYQASSGSGTTRPKLLLPKPGHTAFAIFEDAVTLVSMTDPEDEGPEAQLDASYMAPETFEDTVYLRSGYKFTGGSVEDSKAGHASIISYATDGLVRVQANDPAGDKERSTISTKAIIEQAVFYGAMQQDNVLDFSRGLDHQSNPPDLEDAVLTLSREILKSSSALITANPASIESHLAHRAQALQALLEHVRRNYSPMSAVTMWQMLWDAERIAAGQSLWKVYEGHLAQNRATVLEELSKWFQEDDPNSEDSVRQLFLHHLDDLDRILPRAKNLVKDAQENREVPQKLLSEISETDDLWLTCLETVYAFRSDNASAYGINPASFEDGIMLTAKDYAGLPEPWTATGVMLKASAELTRCARQAAKEAFEREHDDTDGKIGTRVEKIAKENAGLVQLCCLIFQERIRWCASRDTPKERDWAQKLQGGFEKTFYEQCRALAEVGQAEAGMALAEKYRDMATLTEMVVAETQYLIENLGDPESEEQRVMITKAIEDMNARVGRYFDRFGDDWANAFFDQGFSESTAGLMLSEAQEHWPAALARYLRMEPDRARICWINDIVQEGDYLQAGKALTTVATEQETKLWAKKVELSMSKLALIAAHEKAGSTDGALEAGSTTQSIAEANMVLVNVQEQLYEIFRPEILHCIDEEAEVEVAMKKWGSRHTDLQAITQVFQGYLANVLAHRICSVEELIDVLTFMEAREHYAVEEESMEGKEYYLALVGLNAMAQQLDQRRFETLLKIIWKRCYVHDDWVEINKSTSQKKSDEEMHSLLRKTAPWRTLFTGFAEGLFDRPDSYVRVLSPSECLGAGCSSEDLRYRFHNEDILQPILNDLRIQDETLQQYVTDRRLDSWADTCREDAKSYVDAEAEDRAAFLQGERTFEEQYLEDATDIDGVKGNGNGHMVGLNGYGHGGYDGSESESGIDGNIKDEDVEMS